jgi:hypothetical protein
MGMMMILEILQDRPSSSRYILLPTSTFHLGAGLPPRLYRTVRSRLRSKTVYRPRYPRHPRQRHPRTGSMHGRNLRTHQYRLSHYAQHLLLDPTRSSFWLIRLLLRGERRTRRKARLASDLVDGAKRMMILGLVGRRIVVVGRRRSIILGNHRECLYHIACLCILPATHALIAVIRMIYN